MGSQYMFQLVFVGAGGCLGSIFRFVLNSLSYRFLPISIFPYGTLTVNIIGCFLIGLLNGLAEGNELLGTTHARLFIFVGFLGGFTTFSAFGYETLTLAKSPDFFRAILNIGLHLFLGLSAVVLGQNLAEF